MPTETELLHAVLRAPDDDAPRLEYAAWCDQQSDPRGEFIRLDLRIAAMSRSDPGIFRLADDADEMARRHGSVWAADLAPLVERYEFRRGFVELVAISGRDFLAHAPRLMALAPIRHIDFLRAGEVAADLFRSPYLASIRSLRLDRCGLGDDEIRHLADSPYLGELRWLSLLLNNIGMEGARAMAGSSRLPRLKYAGFFGNEVDPGEEHATDQGVVVAARLPKEGEELEAEFGPIPWLHCEAVTINDVPPRRF